MIEPIFFCHSCVSFKHPVLVSLKDCTVYRLQIDSFFDFDLMIAYIALFSALLSRLTALACDSTRVTSFL